MTTYTQKITFGEMRESGVRDVLIYCRDHRCSHNVETNADGWADDVRLSDIEPNLYTLRQAWRESAAEVFAGAHGHGLASPAQPLGFRHQSLTKGTLPAREREQQNSFGDRLLRPAMIGRPQWMHGDGGHHFVM